MTGIYAIRLFDEQEICYERMAKTGFQSLRYNEGLTLDGVAFWDPIQVACADADASRIEYINHHTKIWVAIWRVSVHDSSILASCASALHRR
jgi:hypothetical protein